MPHAGATVRRCGLHSASLRVHRRRRVDCLSHPSRQRRWQLNDSLETLAEIFFPQDKAKIKRDTATRRGGEWAKGSRGEKVMRAATSCPFASPTHPLTNSPL